MLAKLWQVSRNAGAVTVLEMIEGLARLLGRRGPYGVLKLELAGELSEAESEQRLFSLFVPRAAEDYVSLLGLLRWAREDPGLQAVLIRCDDLQASWARLQGLRRSLQRLREAGKRVWVHLDGAGIQEYYLASVADQVSLRPAGTVDIAGLSSEAVFLLGAFEKLGVRADVVQVGRYKSAAEMFTRRDMSEAHREMMESLLDDLYDQIVSDVAVGRGIETGAVRAAFDRGPLLAAEARDAKLVDVLQYADEVEKSLVELCGGAPVIERDVYFKRRSRRERSTVIRRGRGTLGMLHVHGTIKTGESMPGPDGDVASGSGSIATDLKELRERDDIRGVVVRVMSPGGSGAASDLIWREIVRTAEKKPLVVSLSDVAASGGYYVAAGGQRILAEAGTITGSIGVLAGKANLRGLYEHLGVTKESVERGRHASIFSDYVPLGDEERSRIEAEARFFYEDFVGKVATARKLTPEAVAAVAEGRVWTGRQAWTRGLVDELGGIEEALDAVKQMLDIPVGERVAVERYPKPRRLWRFSLDLGRHHQGRLADITRLFSRFSFLHGERIWAVLPFELRFR